MEKGEDGVREHHSPFPSSWAVLLTFAVLFSLRGKTLHISAIVLLKFFFLYER